MPHINFAKWPGATRGYQGLPEAARGCQRLPEAARGCQTTRNASKDILRPVYT